MKHPGDKPIETESRFMFARMWGKETMGMTTETYGVSFWGG